MSVKTLPELKAILLPDIFDVCLNLHYFHLAVSTKETLRPRERLKVILQKPVHTRITDPEDDTESLDDEEEAEEDEDEEESEGDEEEDT